MRPFTPSQQELEQHRRLRERSRGTNGTIHLAVPDLTDGFNIAVAGTVVEVAAAAGYATAVSITRDDPGLVAEAAGLCAASAGCHLIRVSEREPSRWELTLCPAAQISRRPRPGVRYGASGDVDLALTLAVNHLAGMGHRRIHLVDHDRIHLGREPLQAPEGRSGPEVKRVATTALTRFAHWADWERPTAFLAADDVVAAVLHGVLERAQLHVPADVSIVSLSSTDSATPPHLTVVDMRARDIARTAAWLLANADGRPRYSTLEPVLVPGSTSAPPGQPVPRGSVRSPSTSTSTRSS